MNSLVGDKNFTSFSSVQEDIIVNGHGARVSSFCYIALTLISYSQDISEVTENLAFVPPASSNESSCM